LRVTQANGLLRLKMSGKHKQKILLVGGSSMHKDDGGQIVEKGFGSIYDYGDQGKPTSDYYSVIEQSHSRTGESKGTSAKTGLLVIGLASCLIIGSAWIGIKSLPDVSDFAHKLPFIELFKDHPEIIGASQELKQTPGFDNRPSVNTKPIAPIYQIDAIMNDGNTVRVDVKVEFEIPEGNAVSNARLEYIVSMSVKELITQYSAEELYKSNRAQLNRMIMSKITRRAQETLTVTNITLHSLDLYFNARTKEIFDAKINQEQQILRFKSQLQITKARQKVMAEEMKADLFNSRKQWELEREKSIYEAKTKKMVNEILKKRMNDK
jgi:hypothetical protein